MISGIHHISMKCGTGEEFDRAVDFYLNVLGFSVVREWPEGIMIDSGRGLLEIFSNGTGIRTKGAIRHVAFSTDDVDGIVAKVKAAGYEVFIEPNEITIRSDPVFHARMAFCYGPLGEEIEFFQERHPVFLFDLDQTLLDFHASEYKALKIVLTANGLSFSDEIYQAFKAYNKSLWLELEKGAISRTELFTRRFQFVFSRCDGDSSGLDPLAVNDDFIRTMSVNGVLMDGALEFVKKLKDGIPEARIYIASNGATVNAKGRIASTGLDRYIDGLFVSEDMGVAKPDAAFFDLILKQIKAPKESCIMIGDSLTSDMLGAKNASLASVWFMPTGDIEAAVKACEIDACASSFEELYEVLKRWAEGRNIP